MVDYEIIEIQTDAKGLPLEDDYQAGLAVGKIVVKRDDNGFPVDAALVAKLREHSEI